MRPALKILKLFTFISLTILIILFSASFILQDKVFAIFLRSINNNISTKIDIRSSRLSLLRKFPKASFELNDVLIHSSSGLNSKDFFEINTDTLLLARFVSIEFKLTDLIKGNYDIERVTIKAGRMNFFTDKSGKGNYEISLKNKQPEAGNVKIDLEKITISDIKTYYNNKAIKLVAIGIIKKGLIKSRISGNFIDFVAMADLDINSFKLNNTTFTKTTSAGLDLNLHSSKQGIDIKKGSIRFENINLSLIGFISPDNNIDINLKSQNIEISRIRKFLPEQCQKLITGYSPSGVLTMDSRIKGRFSGTTVPNIEINFNVKKGMVTYAKSNFTINDLSFAGSFSNGSQNLPETSLLSIKNLKARLGNSELTGTVTISRFDRPEIGLLIKGKFFPAELSEYLGLTGLKSIRGSFDLDLKLAGPITRKENYRLSDFFDLNPEATIVFYESGIDLKANKIPLTSINGTLFISKTIRASNLQFTFKKQKIKIDGEFRNLPEWFDGKPDPLIATCDVSFCRLIPESFLNRYNLSDSVNVISTSYSFPDNIIADINYKIDSLNYKKFSATGIFGNLNYKPGILTFKSLNIESLNGSITGNGFIFQNKNKSMLAKGSFNVTKIDVNKTFSAFQNFGQEFLKQENIAGTLSGAFSILIPFDSLMNPKINSITAEGKYTLINGALLNFEPVKQLSSFVELSELENIRFEKMENDFFIKNNFLYTPQMDIKSSAVDLSVNGKHSFNNDYEYHVKMLLSEFLSKKRKKNSTKVSEFGTIEDDGLGRTSMLLKVIGRGENLKVGYDLKAASGEIKNSIKSEKQTLKTILNQEYGWYKNENKSTVKPPEKKSKVKISWDGIDSTKTQTESSATKKEDAEKNLFKKK
jgi:hypothetical protein